MKAGEIIDEAIETNQRAIDSLRDAVRQLRTSVNALEGQVFHRAVAEKVQPPPGAPPEPAPTPEPPDMVPVIEGILKRDSTPMQAPLCNPVTEEPPPATPSISNVGYRRKQAILRGLVDQRAELTTKINVIERELEA